MVIRSRASAASTQSLSMQSLRTLTSLGACVLLTVGCRDRASARQEAPAAAASASERRISSSEAGSGPRLVAVDSIRLSEPDTLFLGRPRDLAVDGLEGHLFVSDSYDDRVVEYDRNGTPLRVYGTRGGGPGEFSEIGGVFVDDSSVYAEDVGQRRLHVFRRADGSLERTVLTDGAVGSGAVAGGTLWLGVMDRAHGSAVTALGPDGVPRYIAPLPVEYTTSEPIAGIFTSSHVLVAGDTLVVALMAAPTIFVLDTSGTVRTSLTVPAARRRGVPRDTVAAMARMKFPEMFGAVSALFRMGLLEQGRIGLVHYDQSISERTGSITAKIFLSVVDPARRRACIDAPVPASPDAQPQVAFRGDTLFLLEQIVDGTNSTSVVRTFAVETDSCRWVEVDPPAR